MAEHIAASGTKHINIDPSRAPCPALGSFSKLLMRGGLQHGTKDDQDLDKPGSEWKDVRVDHS